MPDGYSYDSLKAGYEATTKFRKPPALVDMGKETARETQAMKHKIDSEYFRKLLPKRKLDSLSPTRERSNSRFSGSDQDLTILENALSRASL